MKKRNKAAVLLLKTEHPLERPLFQAALFTLFILVSAYGYFIGISIFDAIGQKEAAAESVRLETTVGALETEHFALSETITPERGAGFGLSAVPKKYVYRPGAVGVAQTAGSGI